MGRRVASLLALALVLAASAACGQRDDTESSSGGGGEQDLGDRTEVVIGLTVSHTGKLTAESTSQFNGLKLWADEVNSAGGIEVGDTSLQVVLKDYDDESEKTRVQQLVTRLINEDKADFLVSPYSSGLTEAAAVVAEQNQKVTMAIGAASDSIFQAGLQYAFQLYTPSSRYLTGSVELLAEKHPDAKRIAIVHEEETFSTDVAEATKSFIEEQGDGTEVVLFEGYPTGTTDFGPFISRIAAADPDAVIGGGHFQDGSTLVRELAARQVPLKMISILVAPSVPEFAQLGSAAVGVVGPSQWEPGVAFSAESAKAQDQDWFGPDGADFVTGYEEAYGVEPGYHAAGGYVAGVLLQHAIEESGSVASDDVKKVLEEMDAVTFWGALSFSDEEGDHGRQIGHEMVQIQWQQPSGGEPVREIVFPEAGKTADFQPLVR